MVDKLESKWWIFYEFWILNLDPRFFFQATKVNQYIVESDFFAVY